MSDARATAVAPDAALLIAAVREGNGHQVAALLATITDWPALAVVLADAARPTPNEQYVANVLDDLRTAGYGSMRTLARRYGLTVDQLRRIASDNDLQDGAPEALTGGRWAVRKGIRVWTAGAAS